MLCHAVQACTALRSLLRLSLGHPLQPRSPAPPLLQTIQWRWTPERRWCWRWLRRRSSATTCAASGLRCPRRSTRWVWWLAGEGRRVQARVRCAGKHGSCMQAWLQARQWWGRLVGAPTNPCSLGCAWASTCPQPPHAPPPLSPPAVWAARGQARVHVRQHQRRERHARLHPHQRGRAPGWVARWGGVWGGGGGWLLELVAAA